MSDTEFIKELERRYEVNEMMFREGKILKVKYEANKTFFRKIAATIERNRELEMQATPDIMTENFVSSFVRELKEYGLKPVFTIHNEVRILKQDFTAFK